MSKPARLQIWNDADRAKARKWIDRVPKGWTLLFKPPTRSNPASKRMWALLDDVADQKEWEGKKRTSDEWKDLFSACLRGQEIVRGLEGGLVAFGARTSEFSPEEMSDMITFIEAWGANHNVIFSDTPSPDALGSTPSEGARAEAADGLSTDGAGASARTSSQGAP